MGIVACGIGYNYLMEVFGGNCPYPVVKVSQYPLPRKMITKLAGKHRKIACIRRRIPDRRGSIEGYLEKECVLGRLDGTLPRDGELNPDHVAKAFGLPSIEDRLYRRSWHLVHQPFAWDVATETCTPH